MRTYNKQEIALMFEDTDRFVEEREHQSIEQERDALKRLLAEQNELLQRERNDSASIYRNLMAEKQRVAKLESRLRDQEAAKCEKKN